MVTDDAAFSAALCCGLIEAHEAAGDGLYQRNRFPQRYAAASLKHPHEAHDLAPRLRFPQRYAAASLKLLRVRLHVALTTRFPQRYAAASLKHSREFAQQTNGLAFSAALCCGLIEAIAIIVVAFLDHGVFRSVMLRPH